MSGSMARLNWSSQRNSKRDLRQGVVPRLRAGMPFGQICRVSCDLVCDHALLHIVTVGETQVLFGGDVTEHGCAVHPDDRRTDG